MNEIAPSLNPPPNRHPTVPTWKIVLAVILGPCCFLLVFLAEVFGDLAGFAAVSLGFLLVQHLLSRGLSFRQSQPLLLGLTSLPVCLGLIVIFAEHKSGAWWQGVLIIVLSLTCSLAGAALASRLASARSTSPA